ncbi:MAG: sugar phosphate isomerase/epimerase family protein [Candidatus Cyclobacteriaceae bacterium M3_2C_046]
MSDRRIFLKHLAAGSAALLAWQNLSAGLSPSKKVKKFGYITGIIKKELEQDWKQALKQSADYGFSEIETGGYMGDSASEFLAYCRDIGLKPVAGGISMTEDQDELMSRIDNLKAINVDKAVIYWPWKVGRPFGLEDCKVSAEMLNTIGETCKNNGMTLYWHNHDGEFNAMEEGLPFDYLMQHTDPDLVKCELDVYWAKKGGADPVEVMKKYPGRYGILHIKDMNNLQEMDFACPGEGIIDFAAVFEEAYRQDMEHFMVERDKVVDGMACLQSSSQFLKNLRI